MRPPTPKDVLRRAVTVQRGAISADVWAVEDRARTSHLLEALGRRPAVVVALYASRAGEPGTTAAIDLLHVGGCQVLLPVLSREPGWALFTGWEGMRPGWGAIPQPTGPRIGGRALALADVVVVPCLAVARDGTRLGTGGGWYDRALPDRRTDAPIWALARSSEVHDSLPANKHDVAVDAVITQDGFRSCGGGQPRLIGQSWPAPLS